MKTFREKSIARGLRRLGMVRETRIGDGAWFRGDPNDPRFAFRDCSRRHVLIFGVRGASGAEVGQVWVSGGVS